MRRCAARAPQKNFAVKRVIRNRKAVFNEAAAVER